jgi:DNA polymerase-4
MKRLIFHVDIDAFYASVEQQDNPSLKGKPVIVGALPGHRGVVSACSYEARRFGVHSAMPISQAIRRCPHGVFLPVRMGRYLEVSKEIMEVLRGYTPEFHQISVDEAWLDLTGTERLLGPPLEVAERIKSDILQSQQLTLSIGIAGNSYLAKLASEAEKPDGLVVVESGQETAFLDTLELKDLWGVGSKTLQLLQELNIMTMPRLREFSLDILSSMLGEGAARFLYSAVRGGDPGFHPPQTKSHSVSNEVTFERDRRDREGLERTLLDLSQHVMARLIQEDQRSKTICIKVRFHDFTTTNAQKTLKHWVTSSNEVYRVALGLLRKRWDGHTPIRLIGVGFSGVKKTQSADQGELFPDSDSRKKKLEETVIGIKKRHKGITLTRASLLGDWNPRERSREQKTQKDTGKDTPETPPE